MRYQTHRQARHQADNQECDLCDSFADDLAEINQIHLPPQAFVRRINHTFFAVGTEPWMRVTAPFADVFGRRVEMTERMPRVGFRVVQVRMLFAVFVRVGVV